MLGPDPVLYGTGIFRNGHILPFFNYPDPEVLKGLIRAKIMSNSYCDENLSRF
jgi:hypothetical protein